MIKDHIKQDFLKNDIFGQNIKGLLIDFDNTMYDYSPCHDKALKAAYTVYNKKYSVEYDDFLEGYFQAQKEVKSLTSNQAASHSRLLYFQKMVESKEGRTGVRDIIHLEKVYWSTFQKNIMIRKNIDLL